MLACTIDASIDTIDTNIGTVDANHQYQPAVLIKHDNLSTFILISIVDKEFPRWGRAEGLDAAWWRLGSPAALKASLN